MERRFPSANGAVRDVGIASLKSDEQSDEELVKAWKAGDSSAGDALLRRHQEPLRRFLRRRTRAYDDLVQETLLRCTRAIASFRGDANFRAFLLGVAANVQRDHRRRQRYQVSLDEHPDALERPQLDESIDSRRRADALRTEIDALPRILHEAIALQYWSELTSGQIAERLNIKAATARRRQSDARRLLAEALHRSGKRVLATTD